MTAVNPSGWRPSAPSGGEGDVVATVTGNRALMLEEPLLFEIGSRDQTGIDLESIAAGTSRLGGLERHSLDLPGLSEPEAVARLPIDHFDGLGTFEDLPRDGRCVADYWF